MYWDELTAAIVLGSAALIVAACKRWRFLYIIVCVIGSIGMPLGFSACIYDAATGKAVYKALLLIVLFSFIVIVALICGRRLLPLILYRMVFLFGCVYYIFVSAGLFGHYYLSTQGLFFQEIHMDIFENYDLNNLGLLFPKLYLYWSFIKTGLPFFFELPEYEMMTVVNITQFFVGRMIEICAIGTIADGIARIIMPIDNAADNRIKRKKIATRFRPKGG